MNQYRPSTTVRWTGAALLVAAAIIHVVLIPQYPIPALQILFVLSALGLTVGAVLLAVGAPTLGWVLGGGTALLTAIGYVVRSTLGIPGVLPFAFPFFSPPTGPISVLLELIAVGLAARALRGSARPIRAAVIAEMQDRVRSRAS
ncbi:hypothetical protein [Pseudonocardia sp. GCM10023141]|uniref:hypothetical protein n=1 Tax=Pseudonocardia sp. GCM10023141 TaxID=3252653 RepID=UPI00361EA44F